MRRKLGFSVLLTVLTMMWFAGRAMAQSASPGESTVESINYFDWFIVGGGSIGWLLILMDVASVAIIIQEFITIRRMTILPEHVRAQVGQLIEGKQYREVIEFTSGEPSLLSYVIHQALSEASHGYGAMERAMEEAAEERTTKLLRKVEILNLMGNIGPMLGLLGTVYGMILAFAAIVSAGGMPQPADLAYAVGIALVTTFWGLIVAIPALAVYAMMRNRIDALSSEAMTVSQEIISTFRPGAKKTT